MMRLANNMTALAASRILIEGSEMTIGGGPVLAKNDTNLSMLVLPPNALRWRKNSWIERDPNGPTSEVDGGLHRGSFSTVSAKNQRGKRLYSVIFGGQ